MVIFASFWVTKLNYNVEFLENLNVKTSPYIPCFLGRFFFHFLNFALFGRDLFESIADTSLGRFQFQFYHLSSLFLSLSFFFFILYLSLSVNFITVLV